MNFKKMAKRFFTLSKGHEGFTLVELIVVIAIMAILAGVAVPAYTGYINKANKASDLQLLGAINTAFAAAAMENDTAASELPDGSVTFDVNKMTVSKFTEDFDKYYAGNAGAKFKVLQQLLFVKGVFVDPTTTTEGVTAVSYAGGTLYLTDAQVEALKNSTFNEVGMDVLLNKVDSTLNIITGLDADDPGAGLAASVLSNNPDLWRSFVKAMGGDATLEDGDLLAEFSRVGSEMAYAAVDEKIKEQGLTIQKGDPEYTELYNQVNADISKNMLVLYAAQNASSQSASDVMAIINSSNPKADLVDAMTGSDVGAGLGSTALVYGAFTAYAKSSSGTNNAKNALDNTTDITAVFDLLENDTERKAFQDYMATEQGKADLNACLSAMNMVNNNTSDKNALSDVLVNGYNNADFVGVVNGLMNPTTGN